MDQGSDKNVLKETTSANLNVASADCFKINLEKARNATFHKRTREVISDKDIKTRWIFIRKSFLTFLTRVRISCSRFECYLYKFVFNEIQGCGYVFVKESENFIR